MVVERIKAKPGEKLSRRDLRRKVHQRLHALGWLVYLTGAARYHDDGDGITPVFRWWHPLSWLMVVVFLPVCGVVGEKISDAIPFRLTKYWRNNPERVNWL